MLSFHEDGTFLKRLPDHKVLAYYHNRKTGLRTIYTDQKAYELHDKTEKEIVISSSNELFKSSYVIAISKSYNNLKMDIILTTKGFNVRDNSNNVTYLFAGKKNGFDSLDFNSIENVNLQKDSTLVICYDNPSSSSLSSSYLFTYKNGVASFHKKYDWDKLKKYNGKKNFYFGKNHTYMHRFGYNTGYNTGFQIKDDTTITSIRYSTNNNTCHFDTTLIATDENYLWLASPYSKCVGRLRHDTYFVEGNVFYDTNQDGYKSSSEFGYPKVKLIARPSGLQLTPDHDGNFAFKGEQGKSYKIDIADSIRFSSIIKNNYNNAIGVKLKDEYPEINTSFWLPRARCFTKLPAAFYLQNTGVVPVEKVVIRLAPKNLKLLQNGALVDTATFTYQNLGVHQSASLAYDIEWPEAELTGQTATLKTITDLYVNGVVASRKIDSVQTIIRCSYDPNDKSVTPAGISDKLYTLKTSTLQYQIRFENTGNDTAYHVVIRDTLNSNLDFSTFEVLGSSHKMNAEISKNGLVGFHFNYINLPDSTTDKKGAQGYVRFSIKPKTTVANNTLLCNKAAIYFDQNKPILRVC